MMNKNVEAFKKYYDNATKEQVIEDMFLDICDLQQRIDKAIEYIEYIGIDATFDKVLIEILGEKE